MQIKKRKWEENMKKIVCFALAALMALSMAACGSNSSTTVSKTVTIEKVEDLIAALDTAFEAVK